MLLSPQTAGASGGSEAPLAYVSELVLRHIASRSCGGAIFDGSILFLDIVASTELTNDFAAMGPDGTEQLAAILDRYFGTIFDVVAEFGGDVIDVDGDAVIALWHDRNGATSADKRARAAALALDERLGQAAFGSPKPLRQRIVVSAGTLRSIPLDFSSDYRMLVLIGDALTAVDVLLKACPPGQVRLPACARPTPRPAPTQITRSGRAGGDPAAFVSPIIATRLARGPSERLAEFRLVTSVMIRLDGLALDDGPDLISAATIVQQELAAVGLGIAALHVGDKGIVLKLLTGLPPYSMENNARFAVEAAHRVLPALRRVGFDAGIGVATGRSFIGEVGNATRRALATIGPVMARSARLMQASHGEILCDGPTVKAVGNQFAFADAVSMMFKGGPKPQRVHRMLGRSSDPLPAHRRVTLLGRDDEIGVLAAYLGRAREGSGGLVVIEGEAGIGKSSLLAATHTIAEERGFRILFSAAQALEVQSSYTAFRQVLVQLLGGEAGWELDPASVTQRLLTKLSGDPLQPRAEVLSDVIPLETLPLTQWPRLSGAARPNGVADLFVRLLGRDALAPTSTPALFLDDGHWLDAASIRLLSALLRRVPALLVVIATRPPELGSPSDLRDLLQTARLTLPLGRLDQTATGELVKGVLGEANLPRRLIEHIHAQSEGLPLHAEQLVLAMRDRGSIRMVTDDGRVELDMTTAADVETLRDVIVRRVDLLPHPQQEFLRVASVLGRSFETALLQAIHPDASEARLLDAFVGPLEAANLLRREGGRLAFRHVRIQEVIHDLLPFQIRRVLHARAARALEQLHADEIYAHLHELAAHWEYAGDPVRGAGYRMRAARRAMDAHAHNEVMAHLQIVEQQGGHTALLESDTAKVEFARLRGMAAEELGDFATARVWLTECAALSGVQVRTGSLRVIAGIGVEALRQVAFRCGLPFRNNIVRAGRDVLDAQLHLRFAEHAYYEGDAPRLLEVTLTALNRAERAGAGPELVAASGSFALGLSVAGLHRLAKSYGRRAMDAGRSANRWDYGMAHLLSAVRLFALADWPEVERLTDVGAGIFERLGERDRYASCRLMAAFARIAKCEIVEAQRVLDQFGKHAQDIDNAAMRDFALLGHSLIEFLSGAPAEQISARFRQIRGDRLSPGEVVLFRGVEAAAALANGDIARARTAADQALLLGERQLPTISIAYFGVVGMAVTQRVLAASTRDPSASAKAARASKLLRRFAGRMPVSRPYAYWLTGVEALGDQARGKAAKLFQCGVNAAERLGTPLEAAHCRLGLAASSDAPDIHAKAAHAILEGLGTVTWTARLQQRMVIHDAALGLIRDSWSGSRLNV